MKRQQSKKVGLGIDEPSLKVPFRKSCDKWSHFAFRMAITGANSLKYIFFKYLLTVLLSVGYKSRKVGRDNPKNHNRISETKESDAWKIVGQNLVRRSLEASHWLEPISWILIINSGSASNSPNFL
jgi:hypothetical protein